jgi:hypothetical protein
VHHAHQILTGGAAGEMGAQILQPPAQLGLGIIGEDADRKA